MIWLFLLGLFTYLFITQWVSNLTRTSVWLLWSVAMLPVFVMVVWTIVSRGQTMPTQYSLVLFAGCLVLYLYLIQRGRIERSTMDTAPPAPPEPISEIQPPNLASLRPLNQAEESSLQTCFPWSVFYLKHLEYHPQGVVCRGQLRTTPEAAYRTIRENVEAQFGDRFHVIFQEYYPGEPFFELVVNPAATIEGKNSPVLIRPGFAAALFLLTMFTTTWAGLQVVGRVPTIAALLENGFPYSIPVLLFFAARSFGQFITARKYKIAITLPYFVPIIPLPFFPLGTIGAFTQLKSPIPDRKALFDIGLVGAFMGLIISIPLLAWGLVQSSVVALPNQGGLFNFQALDPRFSILLAIFGKLAIGRELTPDAAIRLNPMAIAGWVGVMFTAFNLMPIGQLDGGRMIHAVFGRRMGARIGRISRFLLLGFAIVYPHLLLWAVLLLLLPALNEPTLNDVLEVDSFRDIVGLLALVILMILVLPAPKFLTTALGM
ncbi:site-2 protease family protein [Leptolyngbya sp. NIES-2104]|uniref:site-2 protease family protein n=1 Tax=Leptolyngbya sp. NIES-2104 TaxID=1552121 RepID=UPI00073EEBC5|nr:site-2 protease family protein [Leptolyngbya sp. NIES-2104]